MKKYILCMIPALVIAAITGSLVLWRSVNIPASMYEIGQIDNYFGADIARVYSNMTDRESNHYRTKVHPLFSLVVCAPIIILIKLTCLNEITAIAVTLAINATIFTTLCYFLLLIITKKVLDTILFLALIIASGSFMLWMHLPETFPFGSTTILISLIIVTIPCFKIKDTFHIIGCVASGCITITNMTAGVACAISSLTKKRLGSVILKSFVIISALWSFQKFCFPSAGFFFDFREEVQYVSDKHEGFALRQFFLHSFYPGSFKEKYDEDFDSPTLMLARIDEMSKPGIKFTVWVTWLLLLGAGITSFIRAKTNQSLKIGIGLFITLQLVLHLFYSTRETFIYSIHWFPALVFLAAFTTQGRLRHFVLVLTFLLATFVGIRNFYYSSSALRAASRTTTLKISSKYNKINYLDDRKYKFSSGARPVMSMVAMSADVV